MLPADLIAKLNQCATTDFVGPRDFWFKWLTRFTTMVAVGLVFELPELTYELRAIAREWIPYFKYRIISRPHREHAAKAVAFIGWIFIVAGVTGERVAEVKVKDFDVYIQECSDVGLQEAKETAGGAYERAAQTEKEAAEDLKITAQIKKDAEDERLARAKIEAAVGWRSLGDQQKRDIGTAVASFSTRVVASIWFDASSTEAGMFADDIAEALRFGHITTTAPGGIMHMQEGGKWNGEIKSVATGVVIQSTRAPTAIEFAGALIKELNSRGFDAKRQTDPPFDEKTNEPVIWVNVEARPRGPQGDYKLQAEKDAKAGTVR
jgi:hypothetical protein